jgi:ectoine hydroxylase
MAKSARREEAIDAYPSRTSPEPRILPRLDPVVYSDWSPQAPITKAEADHFDRLGHLVLKDRFAAEEVAFLQAEAARLIADPALVDRRTVITERDSEEVRSIFEIHAQNAVMARLAADARLADVARFLLGDDVYVHQSRLNYKPGFEGRDFYWHSDFETWHVEDGMPRMRALSISVLLAPNTANNGPLMLMPGSHRSYVACVGETPDDHYRQSLQKQEYGVPDRQSLTTLAEAHDIVAPTGDPGTIIVFDCNMMHGSNGNITPLPRSNAFIVYNALSNGLVTPFGGMPPRPSFVAAREAQALPCSPEPLIP